MGYLRRRNAIQHPPPSSAVINTHDVNKAIQKSRPAFRLSFAPPAAVLSYHGAFHRARFIQDALKQAPNRGVRQRAGIRALHAVQNLLLAVRLVERIAFDVS